MSSPGLQVKVNYVRLVVKKYKCKENKDEYVVYK